MVFKISSIFYGSTVKYSVLIEQSLFIGSYGIPQLTSSADELTFSVIRTSLPSVQLMKSPVFQYTHLKVFQEIGLVEVNCFYLEHSIILRTLHLVETLYNMKVRTISHVQIGNIKLIHTTLSSCQLRYPQVMRYYREVSPGLNMYQMVSGKSRVDVFFLISHQL